MFKRGLKARPGRVILNARLWKKVPMKLLRWRKEMKSTTQYNLVPNDEYDTKIPLHPEEAFEYGITFQAKYIGTLDVPRPTSRVEIVAAMRRVRYEFKARGIKKRKIIFDVSTNGVRVTAPKKKGKRKGSKLFGRGSRLPLEGPEILHHPIYRIFYVSHDSSDLKIFSYIARDGATNVFKCNVFKSNRKSQAMKIVRTVGQAFEVCHKMQNNPDQPAPSTSSAIDEPAPSDRLSDVAASKEVASECGVSESGAGSSKILEEPLVTIQETARPKTLELLPPPPRKGKRSPQRTPVPSVNLPDLPECITKVEIPADDGDVSTPLSAQHQLKLLRERLEQQAQQTRAAVAQLLLLRDQLAAEQAARCEAQARTHQLLVHNKELLEHIAALVAHLQERERGNVQPISAQQLTLLPQNRSKKGGGVETITADVHAAYNGSQQDVTADTLIDLLTSSNQNLENNNIRLSPFRNTPTFPDQMNGTSPPPPFDMMSNDQIQNYLISKFQHMGGFPLKPEMKNNNQEFFQNCNAFPHILPFSTHHSSADLSGLLQKNMNGSKHCSTEEVRNLAQAMSVGQSENSLYSNSQPTTSKDSSPSGSSSDEGVPFILPLSHNGTLTATGDDGRFRLIVPVSPSGSASNVPTTQPEPKGKLGTTLKVPSEGFLAPPAPITRTTSEKVPNRSEMMTALRSQWTRHTTK